MHRLFTSSFARRGGLLALALVSACSGGLRSSQAHEWASPEPGSRGVSPPALAQRPQWPGMVWAGPAAGAPAAPSARDCRRAPRPIELAESPGAQAQWRKRPLGDGEPVRPESYAAEAARSILAAPSAKAAAPRSDSAGALALTDRPLPMPAPQPMPAPRPRDEPVTAGVVDDNADFGAYLAYRSRNAHLAVRERDVRERYLLTVHDASGRAVPDAQVNVFDGTRALPLWARTDAGGQVWLHPADGQSAVLEVQVSKGRTRGAALLQRGQKHSLQVRLDGETPPERARLDLVFLVDATGSMADEIDKLRRSMQAMAQQIARLPSQPDLCLALVAYRDRGDAFFVRMHDFTDDLSAFQRALSELRAAGGGDEPEALNEALHTAVHRLSWRGDGATRMLVLVADAPPHLDYGAPYYDDDMAGALARGIKLFAVGASGLNPTGEYIFRQAAQYTGGRFVFLTYAKASDPGSGPGRETVHDVGNYSVETLDKLVVRLVREELARRPVG